MSIERAWPVPRPALATTAALAVLFTACASGDEPQKLTPAEAAARSSPSMPNPHAGSGAATARPDSLPNPHAGGLPGSSTAPRAAGSVQFSVPEGWIVQVPSSAMRKAQFLLPKVEGDAEDAQLVLFHFGGEGGSTQANLDRWADYFVPAGGRTARENLETTTRTVHGMHVTEAFIAGTLDTSKVQGMGAAGLRDNWGMLAAIVETPSGPYFARLLGPAATVSRWDASFRQWISSIQHAN
ncbi:MAG: hypothetical protein JNK02_03440 [Planctomycetes bacterium]|nr:hypothetical protein [Planctomycetota bacterium]